MWTMDQEASGLVLPASKVSVEKKLVSGWMFCAVEVVMVRRVDASVVLITHAL